MYDTRTTVSVITSFSSVKFQSWTRVLGWCGAKSLLKDEPRIIELASDRVSASALFTPATMVGTERSE